MFDAHLMRKGRWIELVTLPDQEIGVDSVTLVGAGTGRQSGWLLWWYHTPQPSPLGPYRKKLIAFEADCTAYAMRFGPYVAYNDSTAVGESPGEDSALKRVVPESIGERVYLALCDRPVETAEQQFARVKAEWERAHRQRP